MEVTPIKKIESPWETGYIKTTTSSPKLRYAFYPSKKPIQSLIVLILGRNEFIEKYSYVTNLLNIPPNCGLLTWDHRGQGESEGQASHCESFDLFVNDAKDVINSVNVNNVPYIIIALSMGSLITLYGCKKNIFHPKAVILISPFLGFPTKTFPQWFIKLVSAITVKIGLKKRYLRPYGLQLEEKFENNERTTCKEFFDRLQQSPYKGKSVTFGWLNAARIALSEISHIDFIKDFDIPITIIAGNKDTIISFESIVRWIDKFNSHNSNQPLNYLKLNGAKHEILNESDEYLTPTIELINKKIDLILGHLDDHKKSLKR